MRDGQVERLAVVRQERFDLVQCDDVEVARLLVVRVFSELISELAELAYQALMKLPLPAVRIPGQQKLILA